MSEATRNMSRAAATSPPMTWPDSAVLGEPALAWTVAYSKPRQEKALAWDLAERGVPYFLPMVSRESSSGGRRRRHLHPLFPSYVFFAADDERRLSVLRTERIVKLIDVEPREQPALRAELTSLETALRHAPESLELYPRLVPGARAIVRTGPLKGVEGVVLNADNKRKLWLGVTALGTGVTIEIHADLVEVTGDGRGQGARGKECDS